MGYETVSESSEGFGSAVNEQVAAAKYIKTSARLSHRLDLRSKTVLTLAENSSQTAECGFSVYRTQNGWQLGIHVADVSEYVCENSPLDLEARRRAAAVETETGISPMLPSAIIDMCSLAEGREKLTVSMILDIDSEGNATSVRFDESVIRVSANCIFEEVDHIALASDKSSIMLIREKYSPLADCITNMYELAALFCAKRRAAGGLDCTVFRRVYEKNSDGKAIGFRFESEPDSRAMIREIGYFASAAVGRFMLKNKLPCMFIGQAPLPNHIIDCLYNLTECKSKESDPTRLTADIAESAKGKEIYPFVCDLISANLPCPKFSCKPIVNAASGYDTLISFVHPTKRYSDILTQRIIKETIAAEAKPSNLNVNRHLKLVERSAEEASVGAKFAYDCRRANDFRRASEYILNSDKSEFSAYTVAEDSNENAVLFMKCGLNAVIPPEYRGNAEIAVGTPLRVEVVSMGTADEPIIVKPIDVSRETSPRRT